LVAPGGRCHTATAPIQTVVDNPINPDCQDTYDVDDYARDWADWIGLSNLQGKPNNGADQLVPSIFTIGFGLRFGYDDAGNPIARCTATDYDCLRGVSPANQSYVQDYLGEELLNLCTERDGIVGAVAEDFPAKSNVSAQIAQCHD